MLLKIICSFLNILNLEELLRQTQPTITNSLSTHLLLFVPEEEEGN